MKSTTFFLFLILAQGIGFSQSRFVNAGNGFIGINTNFPASFLTVEGNEQATNYTDYRTFLRIHNKSNSNSSFGGLEILSGEPSYKTVLQHVSSSYYFSGLDEYADFGQLYSRGAGLILRSGSPEMPGGVIKFLTGLTYAGGSIERMRMNEVGNIGIGVKFPKSKLHITNGDVFIDDTSKGIIMKSPNGSCWRVRVDDSGNFSSTNITCPY